MYIYLWPHGTPHEAEEILAAAQFMYYGGDFAELLLVIALFTIWYRRRGPHSAELQTEAVRLYQTPART
jgi:putative membrane protein